MKRYGIAILVATVMAVGVQWCRAAPADDPRLARLAAVVETTGRFTQQRTLKGLSRPLVATGEYAYIRGQGLYWHTLTPMATELLATPTVVKTRLPGAAEQRLDGQIEQRTSAMIFALFTMDLAQLQRDFALELSGAGQWRLVMTPTSPTIALAVASIVLSGEQQVNTIEITAKDGDKTLIQLAAATDAQQALGQLHRWLAP